MGPEHRTHGTRPPQALPTTQSIDSWLKVKFETIPVSKQRMRRLSIPMQKAVISSINRVAIFLHMSAAACPAERDPYPAEKKLIELYEPFILHNEHVFECENARLLSAALAARGAVRSSLRAGIDRLVGLLD